MRGYGGGLRKPGEVRALFKSQLEIKARAFSELAVESDGAAHLLDQLRRNNQAQAGTAKPPAGRLFPLNESLKQMTLNLGRNPDPGVPDFETYHRIVSGLLSLSGTQ